MGAASRQRQAAVQAASLATRAARVPSQAAVLGALAGRDMLPAIWFIFSRAACDRAAEATTLGGPLLADEGERAQIAAEIDALRCAAAWLSVLDRVRVRIVRAAAGRQRRARADRRRDRRATVRRCGARHGSCVTFRYAVVSMCRPLRATSSRRLRFHTHLAWSHIAAVPMHAISIANEHLADAGHKRRSKRPYITLSWTLLPSCAQLYVMRGGSRPRANTRLDAVRQEPHNPDPSTRSPGGTSRIR